MVDGGSWHGCIGNGRGRLSGGSFRGILEKSTGLMLWESARLMAVNPKSVVTGNGSNVGNSLLEMETGSNRQCIGRRDNAEKQTCRVWTRKEEEILLAGLNDLCGSGWKLENGTFRSIIFGKDRATGEIAEGPADAVENLDDEACDESESNVNENLNATEASVTVSQTPNPENAGENRQTGIRKWSRNGDMLVASIGEVAEAFKGFVEDAKKSMLVIATRIGHGADVFASRQMVFGELSTLPNLSTDDIMQAASILVNDSAKIDLIMSLPENF
ncbi:hypothetical protein F0562_010651 [Nyssa sinensis]|uniref:Uncharacterized protein n=1 Tax=Nyssa sinensis TaxID=561372 RepID=A0A5J5A2L0_9ASTE|nr:hypothetical protein F0562_010651 [Nyssa sinensis]